MQFATIAGFRDTHRGDLIRLPCPEAGRLIRVCVRPHVWYSPPPVAGEMAERLKAHAWKACVRESVPRVRIPVSPPGSVALPRPGSVAANAGSSAGILQAGAYAGFNDHPARKPGPILEAGCWARLP